MADSAIAFTLALVDRMSGPARAATGALSALEAQLKSITSLLKDMPKLAIKAPKIDGAAKAAKEQLGPAYGPGRREALAAAKYRDRLEQQSTRAAEQLDKQRQRALYAEYQKQERLKATHTAVHAIQAHVAPIAGADHAAALAGTLKEVAELAGGHGLLNLVSTLGAPIATARTLKTALGELGEGFEHVTGLSPAMAAGIAGVAAAAVVAAAGVVKLAEAAGEWILEGAHMALEAVEAKEKTMDLLEAMLGSEEAAKEVASAIGQVKQVTGVAGSRVAQLARELAAAGETGELLTDSMRAIAQAETVLPEAGAKLQSITERAIQTGKFTLSAKQLVGTGVQVAKLYKQLADKTGKGVKQVEAELKAGKIGAEEGIAALNAVVSEKFGAVAAKQAKDLDVQLERFHSNIGKLFKDVKVEPFLEALQSVLSIVDQATPAGKALHDVLTSVFDGVFAGATAAIPYLKTFLKGLVIIGLQAAIAMKPLMKQLGMTFGKENQEGPKRLAEFMSTLGVNVGKFVALTVQALPVLSAFFSALWTGLAPFRYLATVPLRIVAVLGMMTAATIAAIGWLTQLGSQALTAGENLVLGLVDGITNTANKLYDAVANMAQTALDKFKSIFQIHSPSRVMAGIGGHISGGLAGGIKAGARAHAGAMVGAGARLSAGAALGAHAGLVARAGAGVRAGAGLGAHAGFAARAGLGADAALMSRLARPLAMNDNALADRAERSPQLAEREKSGGKGQGITVQMAAGAIVIQGVAGVAEMGDQAGEMIASWFERVALMNGTSGS